MSEKSDYPETLKDILILSQPATAHFPQLSNGDIHIWTISLDTTEDQIERLGSILSKEEKRKAYYYKFESAQHSYIVSQAVLRLLLSAYLQIEPAKVRIGAHKKGKPYLIHDRSIFFNLSNSHDFCVFAFSSDSEVGIDIEKIRVLPDIDLLIEKNFTSREKEYLQKDPDNKLSRFFQFWTFKESFLKAIGEGMRLTPDNLEFSLEDGTIKLRSVKYGFDTTDCQFKGLTLKGNYTGTLAYSGKETVIREMGIALKEKGNQEN